MASERPISVAGLLTILFGAVIVASGLYQPFDPNYCADGCGIIGNLIPKLMGVLDKITGPIIPRLIYIASGAALIVKGWRDRFDPNAKREQSGP
jgi:hypothetical protein